jgi:hypothetical protein
MAEQVWPATSTQIPKQEGGATVIQPISAEPKAVLSAAERKRRYEELRQRIGKPRLDVRGRPGKHYLWAPRGDSNELDRLDLMGYTIVREPKPKEVLAGQAKPQIQAAGLREDGTYDLGDVILMEVDEEVYEFITLENEERTAAMMMQGKSNFTFEAEKQGVPTFEVDKTKVGR